MTQTKWARVAKLTAGFVIVAGLAGCASMPEYCAKGRAVDQNVKTSPEGEKQLKQAGLDLLAAFPPFALPVQMAIGLNARQCDRNYQAPPQKAPSVK